MLGRLSGGLVVSCQAPPGHPLRSPATIALLARCAELGGAVAVRVNSPADVRAVKDAVALPVIGLHKVPGPPHRELITPGFDLAAGLVVAGADVVAVEATPATPGGVELVERIRAELGVPVMADVSTVDEGVRAWAAGADLVGSTLSGYTPDSPHREEPDLDLVAALAEKGIRVVAEGRLRTPDHVRDAFARGAYAVVVGTAITDPVAITRWLAAAAR